jgi:hypothetical protein
MDGTMTAEETVEIDRKIGRHVRPGLFRKKRTTASGMKSLLRNKEPQPKVLKMGKEDLETGGVAIIAAAVDGEVITVKVARMART